MNIKIENGGDISFKSYHDDYCNRNNPLSRPERMEILSASEQRELLVWFKNNRKEMLQEIFCEDCPEVC